MDTTELEVEPQLPNKSSASPVSRIRHTSFRDKHSPWPMSDTTSIRERSLGRHKPEILSPKPRRHLLETRELHDHWLPISPTSSRAISPVNSTFSRTHEMQSLSSMLEGHDNISHPADAQPSIMSRTHHRPQSISQENSMNRRWTGWMNHQGLGSFIAPAAIITVTWVKYCISLGSYSGQGIPPMFGDYEAQRHWMELTIHLPISQWYIYDLPYWGLDYPPLTAYHSWLCGTIGSWINPRWFLLDVSRGIETEESKLFMRITVLICDLLIYVTAILMFNSTWQNTRSKRTRDTSLLTLLFQPALLIIDFGHFQYNSIMLGLTLFSINFLAQGHDLLGALCFVLSLGFKQMSLYYAPAIGSYLLARCIHLGINKGSKLFIQLGITTIVGFLILFLPFLPPFGNITDPITRIFPFARGLFEDKVANFWCASNVIFKWRTVFSSPSLIKLSAVFTALGFLPSAVVLLNAGIRLPKIDGPHLPSSPILPLLPYALLASSMSFFLFSFQVHEKTILLPLLPITLLLSGASKDSAAFAWGTLANNVACFSMWPLLKRDGLGAQYIALLLLWNRLVGFNIFQLRIGSFIGLMSLSVYTAMFVWHAAELILPPPQRYPDLFPVLNVMIAAPVFGMIWAWSTKCLVEVSWAIGAIGKQSKDKDLPSKVPHKSRKEEILSTNRATGQRAVSLGYAQARRRKHKPVGSIDGLTKL